ncbi:FHA domain-containing protein [Streptomyces sp. NPDC017179]|uniref:FHA domain-containing protein n=1 Tax=Streptomyces sp. NPDC017179 TaxID=3364979 RepID=UPI0037A26AF3
MQIRLTVVDPLGPPSPTVSASQERGGHPPARDRAARCDVLVTAPAGTALAAVAAALAAAVCGEGASASERGGRERGASGGREPGAGPVVLYAGAERLDAQRCTLGEPPLLDGAVLSLGAPADPEPHPELDDAPTQLHVVAGPDAGGVHLLHGGQITVGRSADADVPLDDPDVSRVHCAVTVAPDGGVSVADLGSTNGTVLGGSPVGSRPVRFAPGALLRIGESALRLTPAAGPDARVRTTPDGEGHVRLPAENTPAPAATVTPAHARVRDGVGDGDGSGARAAATRAFGDAAGPTVTHRGTFAPHPPGPQAHGPVDPTAVPSQAGAPRIEGGQGPHGSARPPVPFAITADGGTGVPQVLRRRGGLGAWARRLTGGRGDQASDRRGTYDGGAADTRAQDAPAWCAAPQQPETWPDPAALLLAALGPGPRLWERGPGHPEALTVRLGTADRPAPDGSGLLPAVPVTADLREVGALGLAGPRARLSGLARAVLAQLAAAHSPDTLEIVLISADGGRPLEERTAEWSWLGWLPHVRPARGQDCRLLLAHDRGQAAARTDELLRRVEDHTAHHADRIADHPGGAPASGTDDAHSGPRRPSWARDGDPAGEQGFPGPYTVVVVDGDPGGAAAREAVARLAHDGPRAGIHVVCLAETTPASPASPVTDTYASACAVSPGFGECGAVALLSGDVATALRLMRVAGHPAAARPDGGAERIRRHPDDPLRASRADAAAGAPAARAPHRDPIPPGTVAVVDAVSLAWAERFARALAPLRTDGPGADRPARVSAPLPLSARLLDELGLARATPASLQARWADAADDTAALGGRARTILGAGPRGPVCADLVADGPHLLIEGPAGSGRTELLRSIVASLAAAERPDRLGIVLVDGRDGTGAGGGHGDGLRVCTDVPHVTTHLTANDPVRMREFAQSLSAELKRRAELVGLTDFTEWHTRREVSGRLVPQRTPAPSGTLGPTSAYAGAADSPTTGTPQRGPTPRSAYEPGHTGAGPALSDARTTGTPQQGTAPRSTYESSRTGTGTALPGPRTTGTGTTDSHATGTPQQGPTPRGTYEPGHTGTDPARTVPPGPRTTGTGTTDSHATGTPQQGTAPRGTYEPGHTGTDPARTVPPGPRTTGAGAADSHATGTPQRATPPGQAAPADPTGPGTAPAALPGPRATGADAARATQRAAAVHGAFPPGHTGTGPAGPGAGGAGDLDSPPSSTMRLRPGSARRQAEAAPPLPRLVVVVDDLDALVSPSLGSPGRPSAGSVVRALEAVAREGERLGVHLVAATTPGGRTARTEPARRAALRVTLDAPAQGPDEPAPGRGRLACADGRVTPFQGGRVTGRIPRTATQRPTVVPLEWQRMGDPPARRPVRELGNGPTDLALLASALERAAREVSAARIPSLL